MAKRKRKSPTTAASTAKATPAAMAVDPLQIHESPATTRAAARAAAGVEAYWTDKKMRDATPIDLPKPGTTRSMGISTGPMGGGRFGREVISEPKHPQGHFDMQATSNPYSTTQVPDRSIYPFAAVGKLFMTFGNANMVGSAWVIDESAVITAGHCIYNPDTGVWATNVMFAPQYNRGATVGQWYMKTSSVLEGWMKSAIPARFEHDMAAVILTRAIRPSTGAVGWLANVETPASNYLQVGYPAQDPFHGDLMWQCDGQYLSGKSILTVAGNLTPGCSGGPMFITRNAKLYANGLNSQRPADNPNVMCTPYFGDNFMTLIKWVQDHGGGTS